jgi:hypothetical protein
MKSLIKNQEYEQPRTPTVLLWNKTKFTPLHKRIHPLINNRNTIYGQYINIILQ